MLKGKGSISLEIKSMHIGKAIKSHSQKKIKNLLALHPLTIPLSKTAVLSSLKKQALK